jgi:hypothetical protein
MKILFFKILNIIILIFFICSCTPNNSITPNVNTNLNYLKFKIANDTFIATTVLGGNFDDCFKFKTNTITSNFDLKYSMDGWIKYANSAGGPQDPLWVGTLSIDSALKKITFIDLTSSIGGNSGTMFHCDSLISAGAGNSVSGTYIKLNISRNDNSNNGIIEGNFNGKVKKYYYQAGGGTYLTNQLLNIEGSFRLKIKNEP